MDNVKVFRYVGQTSQGQKFWNEQKGLIIKNVHVKYKSPTSYGSKDTGKDQVFMTDQQTD